MTLEYQELQEVDAEIVEEVAKYIKQRRKSLKITQELLSEMTGYGQSFISAVESGSKKRITLGVVAKILASLNTEIVFKPKDLE